MKNGILLLVLFLLGKQSVAQESKVVCWKSKTKTIEANNSFQEVYLINNLLLTENKFNYLQSQLGGKLKRYLKKDNAQRIQSQELNKVLGNGQFAYYFQTELMILIDGVSLENRFTILDYVHKDFCTVSYLSKKDVKKRFKLKVGRDMINIISL
jgi:hypothetical protein